MQAQSIYREILKIRFPDFLFFFFIYLSIRCVGENNWRRTTKHRQFAAGLSIRDPINSARIARIRGIDGIYKTRLIASRKRENSDAALFRSRE